MSHHRDSAGEAIWIILTLAALLLLAAGGGFMWFRQQRATTSVAEAQRAMEQAEMARMQAEMLAVHETELRLQAEHNHAQIEQLEAPAQSASSNPQSTGDEFPAQPLVPEIYLSQHLWQHVDSLADAAPDARVFSLDHETGELVFGDGQHGMPLPEGPITVQATYRTSGGGTVTVSLPAADLRINPLRATQSADGAVQLEFAEVSDP